MAVSLDRATSFIQYRWRERPRVAIILGTGLGQLAGHIRQEAVFPYAEIPDFPRCTALAHTGQLICGRISNIPVVAMQGRCHFYEGYTLDQITLPVRTLSRLGAALLIASNASGGLNPNFRPGDVLLITDHINLLGRRTAGVGPAGGLVPVRSNSPVYDPALIELAAETARRENFVAHRGVYVAVTGPSYETRAEYRAFRRLGGDAVGMSTVPEVLVAVQQRMRVLGLSTITNVARPDAPQKTDAEEVARAAAGAAPRLREIIERVVESQGRGT